jgi:hypothetical protein
LGARSTEFIQQNETADENDKRNPEVKVGRDGAKEAIVGGALSKHDLVMVAESGLQS